MVKELCGYYISFFAVNCVSEEGEGRIINLYE